MRATIADVTLAGTAVVHTAAKTADAQGGQSWTYTASGTVPCHVSPEAIRGGEVTAGGRLAELTSWVLTLHGTATVDEDDRVVVGGVTYEVTEVLSPRTWQLSKRVRCAEVD